MSKLQKIEKTEEFICKWQEQECLCNVNTVVYRDRGKKYNIFNLRKARVANFAETAIIIIKVTIKDSNKVKRIKNYLLKCNLYLYFLI